MEENSHTAISGALKMRSLNNWKMHTWFYSNLSSLVICSFTRSTIRSCWKWELNLQIKLMRTDTSKAKHPVERPWSITVWGHSLSPSGAARSHYHTCLSKERLSRGNERRFIQCKSERNKRKALSLRKSQQTERARFKLQLKNLMSCFDLMTNKIVRLWNKTSKRKIAKASELTIKSVTKW